METDAKDKLTARIREYFSTRDSADFMSDPGDIPEEFFIEAETDESYISLNSRIRQMTPTQRRMLLYICEGHDPGLIRESMDLGSPELFWTEKKAIFDIVAPESALPVEEKPDEQLRKDILHVFRVNEKIHEQIQDLLDELEEKQEKRKNSLRRRWSLVVLPVILLFLFLFIYPLLVRPDAMNLFEKYKNTCLPDLQRIDTAMFWPGQFYEAYQLFNEEAYGEAEILLKNIAEQGDDFLTGSYWLLALIYLNRGLGHACKDQLHIIRRTDPDFYDECCKKLAWDIRKL